MFSGLSTRLRRGAGAFFPALTVACCALLPGAAWALGSALYSIDLTSSVTGEKPQSKLWYHDGSYWAVLRGPDGVAIYEKIGNTWNRGQFMDAVLLPAGTADVKWDGTRLMVLVYNSSPKLFEYSYDPAFRVWNLLTGFPVSIPKPNGSETMVFEEDSTGRAWVVAEGNNSINVYNSTDATHRTWNKTPTILRKGVDGDDIASVLAFGPGMIGVFWSDQVRDEFGFQIRRDTDPVGTWQPMESVHSGPGVADDHIHLTADAEGRVYAITKDDFDRHTLHRRTTNGVWSHYFDVVDSPGTRGIVMLSDADATVYVLWTRWDVSPNRIEYRAANLDALQFGAKISLMSAASSMNNVSGLKQPLPAGNLIAVAEGAKAVWWNGWGSPIPAGLPAPGAPEGLTVTIANAIGQAALQWSPPAGDAPQGYFVYRSQNNGAFQLASAGLVTGTAFTDNGIAVGANCYRITAYGNSQESASSSAICAVYAPPPPPAPGAPAGLVIALDSAVQAPGAGAWALDEGTGQTANDITFLGHTGTLGSGSGADTADPLWTPGVQGTALRFDGSNDRVRIADAPALRFPGSFTVEAWVLRSKNGSADCILSKGDSGRRSFYLELDTSNRIDFLWQSSGNKDHRTTSTATVADGLWHHVAGVYDQERSENRIYLDGVLVMRNAQTGTPVGNSDPLYLGARTTSGSIKNVFHGTIDLTRVASGALYGDAGFTAAPEYAGATSRSLPRLRWQAPLGSGPLSYRIERAPFAATPAFPDSAPADSLPPPPAPLPPDDAFVRIGPARIAATEWVDPAPLGGDACYRVIAIDALGQESLPSEATCVTITAAAKAAHGGPAVRAPAQPGFLSASPNPFNPATRIRYRVPTGAGHARLAIYDVRGRMVATLVNGPVAPGEHVAEWQAGHLASGAYFLVLDAGAVRLHQRLVLLK